MRERIGMCMKEVELLQHTCPFMKNQQKKNSFQGSIELKISPFFARKTSSHQLQFN